MVRIKPNCQENIYNSYQNDNAHSISKVFKKYFHRYFELIFWATALIALFTINPSQESHFSLCLFKNLGLQFCPGCGLGHSISYLLHGYLKASINAHPLGIIAFLIILNRIFQLIKHNL